jgi:omega-3 fatty acid desaturase (delta-15 desaturase)
MLNIVKIIRYYTYPIAGYTMYLFVGMPKSYYSHFNPNAKIFKEKSQVTESITWVAAFGLLLFYFTYQYSFVTLFNYYLMPYFVFVAWIGIVTHFHHTHRDVPWYRDEDWTYLKGALSTIDRNYGVIEDIHHNIGTHIVHHLFMKIPHYNLKKATEQIKPVIGNYYKKSQVGFLKNMTEIFKYCRFVPNEGKRVYYTTKEHQREKQNQH